ncbi:MAG: glycoside hydrolase family 5 protein [Chloroflexi bacterium]|nr:glycoside hydrolase family 5 protein [Chloroflexota bacterium]MCL5274684.1 glycoside hydrolase family 5 protein [Chloroflexota bacterium]
MPQPLHIHPDNPRLFEYRDKPLMLVTASEHYGAVINRPFDIERYLNGAAEKRMTLSRLFLLFRELQSARNPNSTCKPDSSDYVTPFVRSGPGRAADGELRYDLDRWNPEYFARLHRFLALASQLGIIVEVTLFSNTYADSVWALNPFNDANNINHMPHIPWPDYITRRHAALFARQLAFVHKVVAEINGYDNFFFEICNEPGGAAPLPGSASPDEVNGWQLAIAALIRGIEAQLPNQHLIAGQEAFTYEPWEQSTTRSFSELPLDIVNVHPLPNTTYRGAAYDLGEFMSKQLKIRALRDYCLAAAQEARPLNMDEDNIASQFMDAEGWTIHRKRAWTALMSGAHYDFIDFTVNKYVETGNPAAQRHIRAWMMHLSEFIHGIDLARARPLTGWVQAQPPHTLACVLAVQGEDYNVYLADERELDEPGCGEPISGSLVCNLLAGSFEVACFTPAGGAYSVWLPCEGGLLCLPEFRHDLLVRIRRMR